MVYLRIVGVSCATLMMSGCLGGGFGGSGTCPERNVLLPAAEAMRRTEPAAMPREGAKAPLPAYTVEPADVLLIQPADLDSPIRLPGDQPVLPDGSIDLGRYGRLIVAGRTVDEIETAVRAMIQAQSGDTPVGFIDVRLVSRASKVVYVLGEVNAPGAFPLSGRETALDALMLAGGLTDRAAADRIILSRPTQPGLAPLVWPVCYRQIVQLGQTETNYQIQPGDRIFVPGKQPWDCLWQMFGHSH